MPVKRQMTRAKRTITKPKVAEVDEGPSKRKLSSSVITKYQTEILDMMSQMPDTDTLDTMYKAGLGSHYLTCQMCGKPKTDEEFYPSTDIRMRTSHSVICKECAEGLAYGIDETGRMHGFSKASLCTALEYLDKPYIDDLYQECELENEEKSTQKNKPSTVWGLYMQKLHKLKKYAGMRWKDSDGVKKSSGYDVIIKDTEVETPEEDVIENQEQYEQNRRDTIRFCGYDPFSSYPIEKDKPRLYAQIVSFLDDEAKNDALKLAAIVEIVKRLNQNQKLSDESDKLVNDTAHLVDNTALINKIADTPTKV